MQIIYYHNVVTKRDNSFGQQDEFDRKCSRLLLDTFYSQMKRLAANFKPVALDCLLENILAGKVDNKCVAVTFDDGYYGVLSNALPILEELNIPSTVFVVTEHCHKFDTPKPLHFDEIEIAFRLTKTKNIDLDFLELGKVNLRKMQENVLCMKMVKRKLKVSPQAHDLRKILFERLNVDLEEIRAYAGEYEKYRLINWEELKELSGTGMSIGSHTRTHRTLSQLNNDELDLELKDSLNAIRTNLGLNKVSFAYPYGGTEHIGSLAPTLVQEAGYSCAVTTIPGTNISATDPFQLRRVGFEDLKWNNFQF